MEFLSENLWLFWIGVGVFFLIIEFITAALVSIWFVAAAAITSVVSLFVHSFVLQLGIFLILSGVFMIVCRNIYNKHIKKPDESIKAENQLIGKTAVTVENTNGNGGKVLAGDVYWRAVSVDGSEIAKDETVVIKGVETTTLIIEKQ